ncbi:MAG TPA: hypothetical protein VF365_02845 [Candidatus Limnocylindria bacterium]
MARRAGKAASRKARQRYVPKTPRPAPDPAPEAVAMPPVGTPDARQATSLDPPRRTTPASYGVGGGSVLSTRERAEYHYVERDLRNIGILSALMVAMLIAAWFVFNAIGLVG